jgi:hypothetical protein
MNETKITGGKISYGLTRSRKQYESDRADVEVNFTVAEGDSEGPILDKSCASAMRRVHEMLGLPLPKFLQAQTPASAAPGGTTAAPTGAASLFGDK